MNVKALVLAAASAGVAVVTLVALNLIAPITHAAEGHAEGISADQVFSASIDAPGASAPAVAEAMEVAQADTSGAAAAATTEVAQADETAAPSAEPAAAGEPASAPAEGTVPASGGACSTGMVDPNQKPVVVMASGLPGESAAAAPEPEAAPVMAEPAMAEPAPAAAMEPAPAMSEAAPAPEAAPKPKAKPKPKAPKVAPPEAKVAWWPAKTSGKLNLTYAGEASFTKAIVLLFDGAFDNADSANQNVKVTTKSGQPVEGKWLVATGNKQMLLFNAAPGLYKVSVGSGLTDKGNRPISAESSGLVFVP